MSELMSRDALESYLSGRSVYTVLHSTVSDLRTLPPDGKTVHPKNGGCRFVLETWEELFYLKGRFPMDETFYTLKQRDEKRYDVIVTSLHTAMQLGVKI